MNRTDRLHAISEALRRAGASGTTSSKLARDLEVSARTIKRDVSALQQSGALIWSQPGPGGGYVLDDSANLPPVAFTYAQSVAVATALAVLPTSSPFSADVRSASGKVFDTLSPHARERAQALANRVWVLAEPDEQPTPPGVIRSIENSLADQVALSIRYRDNDGVCTTRVIEPIIAAWTGGRWQVIGHCRLRSAIRWFRFDRIESANLTTDHFEPRPVSEIGIPPRNTAPVA